MSHELVAPHSIDAEQAVLGGLMLAPEGWDNIADKITEADFYRRDHRLIFRAIAGLVTAHKPCDAVTLGEWFESNGLEEEVGGANYVLQLANATPSAANILAYAQIVAERAQLRRLLDLAAEMTKQVAQPRADAEVVAADVMRQLGDVVNRGAAVEIVPMRTAVKAWYQELVQREKQGTELTGLETPWAGVNAITSGLQPADLIVVAGRPSMGKTAFMLGLAGHAAKNGTCVAVFSLEMRKVQIAGRLVSAAGSVLHKHLRNPRELDEADWNRVSGAVQDAATWPLFIDDSSTITVDRIVARTRRLKAKRRVGLVVLDYLQLIDLPANAERRDVGFGMVTKALKALAKDLACPVVCLSQLNRGLEARGDKRPMMSDLRDSGAIEQDADVIAFLYRDDYYHPETHLKGVSEVIFAKQREGETGTVYLRHQFPTMQFVDLDGPLPLPPQAQARTPGRFGGFRKRGSFNGHDARTPE